MGKELIIRNGRLSDDCELETIIIENPQFRQESQKENQKLIIEGIPAKPIKCEKRSNSTRKVYNVSKDYILITLHREKRKIKKVVISVPLF